MRSAEADHDRELTVQGLAVLGARNACDREPIHLSGAIQPNGLLLAVDPESLVVLAASSNTAELTGGTRVPLGVPLAEVLGPATVDSVRALDPTGNPYDRLPVPVHLPGADRDAPPAYDLVAHRRRGVLLLELERRPTGPGGTDVGVADFYHGLRDAMKTLNAVDDVESICALSVEQVRLLTGYDRVMVYRFEADAHGHVIAEARQDDLSPYLGLHYPAGDIPRQARALYLRNWVRVISDVDYDAVPLLAVDGVHVDQLDLSLSVLRSVSPVHLQYLRNMGVAATMTISIVVEDRLWGMIACHHGSARHLDHAQRMACESLGQLLSVRLRAAEATREHEHARRRARLVAQVVTAMAAGENPAVGAAAAGDALLDMVGADGVVVEVDGGRVTVGAVPGAAVLDELVPHLAGRAGAGPAPVALDTLPDLPGLPSADDLPAATGCLFLALPGRVDGFVLWLRGEYARTVRWAGRPATAADEWTDEGAAVTLTPRTSFVEWLQTVSGRSRPWQPGELAAAAELGQAMPEVLLHRAQNRLIRLALHDPLTGLPNRTLLHDRLSELIDALEPGPGSQAPGLAVLFVDIDGFKTVNDTQGHLVGDELLTLVAGRITAAIRPQDTVARIGGDEFVVLVPGMGADEATGLAQRLTADFRRSFVLGQHVARSVTLSIGVTVVPPGTEPGEALRQADTAMYHAKRSGRDQVAVFDPASGTAASHQQLAGEELRRAIDSGGITVHYQPIWRLDAAGPELDGFEALARWEHPTRGLVPPDMFIGLAEETGHVDALGDAVLLQSLQQLQAWPDRRLTMAVNVSARQLLRPGFAADVLSRLVELGVEPCRLSLEVTESQMMEQPELTLAVLAELDAADVRIAIDDFGTGFSSLAYVRELPAALLKIDRLFVSGLPGNRKDVAVVAATVQLAHSLGMRTVAEGVETAEQLASLRALGSDLVQGYLLGRPLPGPQVRLDATPAPSGT